jgi:hypothetical protein
VARPKTHKVEQGECLSSIAFEHGFFWKSLWDHEANAELSQARESPFVLKPGDVVHIPELSQRSEIRPTDERHKFRRKGVPAKLRVRLLVMDEPLAGVPYVLVHSHQEFTGVTDDDGVVEVYVPPDVPKVLLRVGEGDDMRIYDITPRVLNPAGEIDGVQARLASLGYYAGPIHGELDDATRSAIRHFQRDYDLEPTGEIDEATTSTLDDAHQSSPK